MFQDIPLPNLNQAILTFAEMVAPIPILPWSNLRSLMICGMSRKVELRVARATFAALPHLETLDVKVPIAWTDDGGPLLLPGIVYLVAFADTIASLVVPNVKLVEVVGPTTQVLRELHGGGAALTRIGAPAIHVCLLSVLARAPRLFSLKLKRVDMGGDDSIEVLELEYQQGYALWRHLPAMQIQLPRFFLWMVEQKHLDVFPFPVEVHVPLGVAVDAVEE
ncbi:hypothetical protein GGF32_008217 [Allomyces javanicus]|nr:hypothetical protein GGF32_008217 [Allomyces javanicus]